MARARRKAPARAGSADRSLWPENEEIQEALLLQQRLFQGERREHETKRLRRRALTAMDAFADFASKLLGPGAFRKRRPYKACPCICLTDNPKDVVFALLNQGIPMNGPSADLGPPKSRVCWVTHSRRRSQLSQIHAAQAPRLPKRGRFAGGCRRDACATLLRTPPRGCLVQDPLVARFRVA